MAMMFQPVTNRFRSRRQTRSIIRLPYITFLLLAVTVVHLVISQIRTWNLLVEMKKSDSSLFMTVPKTNRHAYAFLMAGCHPSDSTLCLGYVYNILVAEYILRHSGSNSDIVVLVRMSADSDIDARLPPNITTLLESSGVHIKYIPKVKVDNFYSAQMDKFNILNLVQYDRVLFMDSDIMPFGNLDYIFHSSEGEEPSLQQNLVIAWQSEPSNGGFFMLTPNHEDFLQILKIQRDHLLKYKGTFDIVQGWGHVIQPPDYWETLIGDRSTNWSFHGSIADQGLLYHWVKYVKKNVSIVKFEYVETWSSISSNITNTSDVQLIETRLSTDVFGNAKNNSPTLANYKLAFQRRFNCLPHSDFHHFTGGEKPWLGIDSTTAYNESQTVFNAPEAFWYHILQKTFSERNLELDFSGIRSNALGLWPTENQIKEVYGSLALEI